MNLDIHLEAHSRPSLAIQKVMSWGESNLYTYYHQTFMKRKTVVFHEVILI